MAKALAAARSGFRRFFSISAFTPPPPAVPQPKADPSPNLFVSGLSKRTTTEGLREAFSKFGDVVHAKVVTDRVSGYSKGFGFVRYASVDEAAEGIKGLDGKFLDGWVIFAEYARPREPPAQMQPPVTQSSYGSPPQSNYSSPTSYSTYNASSPPSNYPSQASQPPLNSSDLSSDTTEPPSSNSYYASNYSQFPPNQASMSPSNYASPTPQTPSSYYTHSPPTPPGFSNTGPMPPPTNYPSQGPQHASSYETQQPHNGYYHHSPQTSQCMSTNGSVPPNYSSDTSHPTYSSQASAWNPQTMQHYYGSAPATDYASQAPQQTSESEPGRAVNHT